MKSGSLTSKVKQIKEILNEIENDAKNLEVYCMGLYKKRKMKINRLVRETKGLRYKKE